MPRRARIHYVSLRSSLVNLPISIYGPLLERSIRPQNLAIHLTLVQAQYAQSSAKVEAYVGWTGMASASSLAHFNSVDSGEKGFETIEIDPQYAQGLGLAQGDLVEIGLLHDLPLAKSVATEPLTSDDWEIIEIHASHVESTLLSQVRVAKIGQEIDVWVLGRTRVRLRVVTLDPQSKGNALLLTTNTEVSIAPKLHRAHPSASSSGKNRTNASPTSANTNGASNATPKTDAKPGPRANPQILRVLPPHVLQAPTIASLVEYAGPELLAYVSQSTLAQLQSITAPDIHQSPPPSIAMDNSTFYKVVLKRLRPPSDPLSSSTSAQVPPPPTTRVLNAGTQDKGKEKSGGAGGSEVHVYVGWMADVPESHVVFPTMVEGIEEWDLIRMSQAADNVSISVPKESTDGAIASSTNQTRPSSSIPFLAGVDGILTQCTEFCLRTFAVHSLTTVSHGVSALLLTGRSGAGKSSIAQAVARSLREDPKIYAYTYYVDLSRYSEKPISTVKALFRHWYDKAAWHRPTILVLDNMEKLLGAEVEHADSFRARHITELFLSMYSSSARSASPNSRGIIILGTAPSTAALHPLISSAHIFGEIVNVKPPNKDARKDIIARIVQERLNLARDMHQDPESPLNYTALATQTEGYSATDLQDLVARAVHQVAIRSSDDASPKTTLTSRDFEAAQVDFVPLSLRDIKLQKSDVAWSDIGGLQETRRILRETLEWPTKYGPIFAQSPLRLRSGLLLYGFPGCGKTLLASAVAKECGLNFISVKGPEILNKYIGASEKSVRDLFERASAAKPCILFFDEFDSIAPKRGHDSTGVTDRVVNQMLTQMDGAEGLDGVYVLAATSRPDLIDSALLRPGRLDKSLFCNMPDLEERKDILQAVARKVLVSSSVDFNKIAEATEGYSGADLQALVYNAHLEVVHSSIAAIPSTDLETKQEEIPIEYTAFGGPAEKGVVSRAEEMALQRRLRQIQTTSQSPQSTQKAPPPPPKKHEITEKHMRRVLETTRPSVSPEERQRLGRIYRAFVSDRSGDLPVPPDAGGVGNRVSLM